jgi:hypothetical protein
MKHSIRGLALGVLPLLLTVAACKRDTVAPATSSSQPATTAPVGDRSPAKPEPYTALDAWDGPALRSVHNFATKKVVFHAATPTPGYQFTFDGAVVEQGKRRLQFTLLQPAASAAQAQVVTDTVCEVDEDKVAGDAATLVVIRRMQQDAHYIVAPAYMAAMSQQ